MNTIFLLIVLTQNGAGDINASFVSTRTLGQCQQKASIVESVFKSSNIPVIEKRCIKSNQQASEFSHASSSSMIQNFYLIHFEGKTANITKQPDWRSCMESQKSGVNQGRVYCSSSVQSLK